MRKPIRDSGTTRRWRTHGSREPAVHHDHSPVAKVRRAKFLVEDSPHLINGGREAVKVVAIPFAKSCSRHARAYWAGRHAVRPSAACQELSDYGYCRQLSRVALHQRLAEPMPLILTPSGRDNTAVGSQSSIEKIKQTGSTSSAWPDARAPPSNDRCQSRSSLSRRLSAPRQRRS